MSKARLGVIGAGNIAHQHLAVVNDIDDIVVVGITSRTRDKAEVLASHYGIPNVTGDVGELFEKCNPDGLLVLVSADQIFQVTKEIIGMQLPSFIVKLAIIDSSFICSENSRNPSPFVTHKRVTMTCCNNKFP